MLPLIYGKCLSHADRDVLKYTGEKLEVCQLDGVYESDFINLY